MSYRGTRDSQQIDKKLLRTTRSYTTMSVVVIMQCGTAVSTLKKTDNRFFVRKLRLLKKGKSAGADNIPSELVHSGGVTITEVWC